MKDKLVAISFLMLSLSCLATMIRAVNGAVHTRFSVSAEEGVTAKDYVQGGLVAMWDGIENVGFGIHDDESDIWIDMSGHDNHLEVSSGNFSDGGFVGIASIAERPACENITVTVVMSFNAMAGVTPLYAYDTTGGYYVYSNISTGSLRYRWAISKGDGSLWQTTFHVGNIGELISCSFTGNKETGLKQFFLGNVLVQLSGSQKGFENGTGNLQVGNTNCAIYNLRIYNRVLSADEIDWNYKVDKERFGL